jgi:hypothetical protein
MAHQSGVNGGISPDSPWNMKKRGENSDSSGDQQSEQTQGGASRIADPLQWFIQKGEFWETRTQEIQMHIELRAGLYRQFIENIGQEICVVDLKNGYD